MCNKLTYKLKSNVSGHVMGSIMRKCVFKHMWTAWAQTALHRPVWSVLLLSSYRIIEYYQLTARALMRLCGCARIFESTHLHTQKHILHTLESSFCIHSKAQSEYTQKHILHTFKSSFCIHSKAHFAYTQKHILNILKNTFSLRRPKYMQ